MTPNASVRENVASERSSRSRALYAYPCLTRLFALLIATLMLTCNYALSARVYAAPGDEEYAQAKTMHDAQNYQGAIAALEAFIQKYPNSQLRNNAELYLGHSYLERNLSNSVQDAATARTHFDYIINQGANADVNLVKNALFHKARTYYEVGDYTQAEPIFQQFLNAYPTDALDAYVYYYLGYCCAQRDALQQAVAYYDRNLTEYPNSPIRARCMLEKAAAIGRQGDYATADQTLQQILNLPNVQVDIVSKVTVQRALLCLVQERYADATAILDQFIAQYSNNPEAQSAIYDAYLFEAYAYFAQKDFQRALILVNRIEQESGSLTLAAAQLKIKLLLCTGQIDAAQQLLQAMVAANALPDLIASYGGMINLERKDYNTVISSLVQTLGVQVYAPGTTAGFNYYTPAKANNTLDPIDFVEACGTLVFAYAGRSVANRSTNQQAAQQDYTAQDRIFNATKQYSDSLNNTIVAHIVQAIDAARRVILNGQGDANINFTALVPYMNATTTMTEAQPVGVDFNGQPLPATQTSNAAYGYGAPNAVVPPAAQNPNAAPAGLAPPTGVYPQNNAQNAALGYPNLPNSTTTNAPPQQPNAGTNANLPATGQQNFNANYNPNAPQTAQNAAVQTPGAIPPSQNNATLPPNQTNNANYNPALDPNSPYYNANLAANDPNAQVQAQTTTLTPEEAQEVVKQATIYLGNQEFEAANDLLLETMTKSESFWQDCYAEATKISLLRAIALYALDKKTEAQMTCKDLVSHAPNSQEALIANFYLGYVADCAGQREDAVKYLTQATSGRNIGSPYDDVALYYLGLNQQERGNIEGASQTFARLYRDYPNSPYWSHGVYQLAKIESDRRNDVVAEKLVNEALASQPDAAIIDYLLFLKGEIALRAKDYDKALTAFDMIVDQYPNSKWYAHAKNRLATIPEKYRELDYAALQQPQEFLEDDLDYGEEEEFFRTRRNPNSTANTQSADAPAARVTPGANASNPNRPAPPNDTRTDSINAPATRPATNPAGATGASRPPASSTPSDTRPANAPANAPSNAPRTSNPSGATRPLSSRTN
ncbi:MAG: tetratricopeptide repeat protein [Planctomycetia bacterium]|nr:tetratricopeptide repeat protein [Planctomycetia bacterium]